MHALQLMPNIEKLPPPRERARNHLPICSPILGRSADVPQSKNTRNRRTIPLILLNRNVVIKVITSFISWFIKPVWMQTFSLL